jgi:hypothetical protein
VTEEPDPLIRQAIQMGRVKLLLTVATQVPVPQIIGQNVNNIGRSSFDGISPPAPAAYEQKEGDQEQMEVFHGYKDTAQNRI